MKRYILFRINKRALFALLFALSSFCFLSRSFGLDDQTKISKDGKFRELCEKIDVALIECDYSTARVILDEMTPYEPCLSFYEKRFQLATDLFLCMQEDNYDDAILKFDRFFKANLDEIEKGDEKSLLGTCCLGLWLYFVNQDHEEIANFVADYTLTLFERWIAEQKDDFKFEADDSLFYMYFPLECAFVFYSFQRDYQGVKRAFSAIQNLLSLVDLYSYITGDPKTLYSIFDCYNQLRQSVERKTPLTLKPIKPDSLTKNKPVKKNGIVVVPLTTDAFVEEDYPIKELPKGKLQIKQTFKRDWHKDDAR